MENGSSDVKIILDTPGISADIREALAFIKSKVDASRLSDLACRISSYIDEDGADPEGIRSAIKSFCQREDFISVAYVSGSHGSEDHLSERGMRDKARSTSGTFQNLYASIIRMIRNHNREQLYHVLDKAERTVGMGYGVPGLPDGRLSVFNAETVKNVQPPVDKPLMSELSNQKTGALIYKPFKKLIDYVYGVARTQEEALLLAIRDFCYRLGAWYALVMPREQESLQDCMPEDTEYADRVLFPSSEPSAESCYANKELADRLACMIRAYPECRNFLEVYRDCGMSGTSTARQIGRSCSSVTQKLARVRLMIQSYIIREWNYCCSDDEATHLLEDVLIPAL